MNITILGITGAIGRATARAFLHAGHHVRALARDPSKVDVKGVEIIEGDVLNTAELQAACRDADVIFHGINVPYPQWEARMEPLNNAICDAAEAVGATILFPGNIYGLTEGVKLAEDAPRTPLCNKGHLRNRLEARLQEACTRGARCIILRAGDFIGADAPNTWVAHLVNVDKRTIQYPTDLNTRHAWACVQDVAQTFVLLADRRFALERFSTFHLEGYALSGHEWVASVTRAMSWSHAKTTRFPWMWMQLARPFVPMVRELFDVRVLWDKELLLDGRKLERLLGSDLPKTKIETALRQALVHEPSRQSSTANLREQRP